MLNDLTAQIEQKRNEVYEFRRMQNAENELMALQEQKQQEAAELKRRQAGIELQKQIDSFKINNAPVKEVQQAIIQLSKAMTKWASERQKLNELQTLIEQQVNQEYDARTLQMTPGQMNSARQGFRAGVVSDIVNERMQLMGADMGFNIQLDDNELSPQEKNWTNYLIDKIKLGLFPAKRHAGM